ncbi:methyl-accepting chemotaxis protein [Paenibacillus turpanensis]|uniref:methyl-accepting chemotaxis protein n=1 Tax=Paenibacillus turpanensis TaxID=2689078 RepID=UPI001407E930|nr:HAMP domain-containing methyl-accepting chemotaxis protein [Paenibacillus turpanensis]
MTGKGPETIQIVANLNKDVKQLNQDNVQRIQSSLAGAMKSNHDSNILLNSLGLLVLLLSLLFSFLFTIAIVKPIRRLIGASSIIASGDLTNPITAKSKDEIGELARNFEAMRQSLAQFIRSSQNTAYHVAASTEQLKGNSSEASDSIRGMTEKLHAIARGSNEQMQSTVETARAMEEMSKGVFRIAELTNQVAEVSLKSEQEAAQGNQLLSTAVKTMDNLNGVVHQFYTTVSKLDEHSRAINQIMDVIKSISSQTNLLSLNAGIEAARAGEHGKGFAVVASEIRKLSEQTNSSSEHIYQIISLIQEDTRSAVATVESGAAETEAGMQTIRSASEAFEKITTATVDISLQIQEISAATEEMTASSEEISATVNQLASIAKGASEQCEEMTHASQDQLKAVMEIASSADDLNVSVHELQTHIKRFKADIE